MYIGYIFDIIVALCTLATKIYEADYIYFGFDYCISMG